MTQIERDALVQSISAMSEEEMRIQYMLDHIGQTIVSQQSFINNVKDAIMTVI